MAKAPRRTVDISIETQPSANAVIVIDLPTRAAGFTYHEVALAGYDGGAVATDAKWEADFSAIEYLIGGLSKMKMSIANWRKIMGIDRVIAADKGILPVRFCDINSRDPVGEVEPSLGTLDVGSLQIKLYCNAAPDIDQLVVKCSVSENTPCGMFANYFNLNHAPTGTGEKLVTLDLAPGLTLAAHYVFNANISRVRTEVGNDQILDDNKETLAHWLREYEKVPNTGMTIVDYGVRRNLGDAVPIPEKVKQWLTFTTSPAGSLDSIVKAYEVWQGN